ncbi:MAG: Hsp20/alpha crystallin family protein [Myxococcales bacterium]|nr:Hsp20/alpha crystallin family protein [Myxococcales bacterium]
MSEARSLEPRDKQELASERTRPGPVFRPDVDILERAEDYVVFADLPGAGEDAVDVRLERGRLTIDAGLGTLPGEGWTPLHTEYRMGSYHREFQVSEDIDADGVSAKMRNGVLELHLPKSPERRPRAIPIRSD